MAKLKDVCIFYSGTGFPIKYQGNETGDYAFYKVGDIANNVQMGNIYLDVCNNYISREIAKEINGCILPKDTVVFAKIGEAVKLNRRAITSADCLIDNNAMGLAPIQEKLRLDYFFYFMKNLKLEKLAESTTVPSVRKSLLEKLEIKIPSLEKQKEIGEILGKISTIIQTRTQQLEKLDLLVKSRFVEMFGDTEKNIQNYPIKKLSEVADVVSGITKGRKTKNKELFEVPYMAVSNVKDGYIDWTTVKTIEATQEEIDKYRLLPNDILMTEGGDPDKVGRGSVIENPLKDCIHQNHIFRVRLNNNLVLPKFFAEFLKQPVTKKYFLFCAKQTTGIASINMRQLSAMLVLLPPLELQHKFELFVQQVDKSKFVAPSRRIIDWVTYRGHILYAHGY